MQLSRDALAGLPPPNQKQLAAVANACWKRDEREYQYAGIWCLRRHSSALGPGFLATAERLIVTKSWWDSVDDLAANVVGGLVRRHPGLRNEMDEWIGSENIWQARTPIIHQLRYRADTDADRLFAYWRRRASDTEVFIRKAIGWALREYTKTDGEAMVRFLRENDAVLFWAVEARSDEMTRRLTSVRRRVSTPTGYAPSDTS